jgi:hypothetical protein
MVLPAEVGRRRRPPAGAGLEFVEKLLTTNLTSTETTERNTGMLRVPHRRIACSNWLPILAPRRPGRRRRRRRCPAQVWPQLLGHDLDYARINVLTRTAPGVFSMQHGLLPEEGSPRAFSPKGAWVSG